MKFLLALFLGISTLIVPATGRTAERGPVSALHVVVQMDDPNPVLAIVGLHNVSNILDSAKMNHEKVLVRVVVLGPALKFFVAKKMNSSLSGLFEALRGKSEIQFLACHHTMEGLHLGVQDLAKGFHVVPSGAYEVIHLQQQGYQYFRP